MRTFVTFQSNRFNMTEPQEYFINPCCFGDDVCRWMIERLGDTGVQCDPEPGQEDFGWYFNLTLNDVPHCIVCALREADKNDPDVWVLCIERSAGFIASLFGGRDQNIDISVPRRLHEVLTGSPDISKVRWHLKSDFDKGNEDSAMEQPD